MFISAAAARKAWVSTKGDSNNPYMKEINDEFVQGFPVHTDVRCVVLEDDKTLKVGDYCMVYATRDSYTLEPGFLIEHEGLNLHYPDTESFSKKFKIA